MAGHPSQAGLPATADRWPALGAAIATFQITSAPGVTVTGASSEQTRHSASGSKHGEADPITPARHWRSGACPATIPWAARRLASVASPTTQVQVQRARGPISRSPSPPPRHRLLCYAHRLLRAAACARRCCWWPSPCWKWRPRRPVRIALPQEQRPPAHRGPRLSAALPLPWVPLRPRQSRLHDVRPPLSTRHLIIGYRSQPEHS